MHQLQVSFSVVLVWLSKFSLVIVLNSVEGFSCAPSENIFLVFVSSKIEMTYLKGF